MAEFLISFHQWILSFHEWILAFHIISVMFWMAGMYYLPRLFVYHAEAIEIGTAHEVFEVMELKLLRIIMNPALIASWVFGLSLLFSPGFLESADFWLVIKLSLVIILTAYHGFLARLRRQFLQENTLYSSRFFRMINEIPPLFTIIIVIMVVVRPF